LETNLVLLAVSIQHGYRIAIGNPDHLAGDGFSLGDANQ
jgi:hypothetical protein